MVLRSYYLAREHRFAIPKGAIFLDIGYVNHPELIFLIDPEQPEETRTFVIVNYLRPTIGKDAVYRGKYLDGSKYNFVFEVTGGTGPG